ncbi:TonB-dependent receptor [Lysobacter arseniciresistens ZS79]|uniref:TonB-dependent receptor n=1 Tax=Lysobacter arseniciresistens ZS79 TaxID=913325 RepID=A0A0A0EQ68_9GAMM|nr:TonB-dependent siderophore receptor [Lysobacter arseniciresistens]KGM53141.1 TonB-dependent receptor [Lysobacter arseniciresistens ZS79]
MPSRFLLAPLSVALSMVLASPAWAGSTGVTNADAAADALQHSPTDLDTVEVRGERDRGYNAQRTRTATKTDTPLRDVPQSITVVTEQLIRDQAMQGIGDVVRYVPGIGIAQGEGNRDAPIFRGNSSTADFFVDGVRDDLQYFRDLYNIERVEALKGANGMIFGRGGSGGVINRVTKQADWDEHREISAQVGSYGRSRSAVDIGRAINSNAAFRVTAMYEDSDSYRDGVSVERYGINPTASFRLGERTTATVGYEHFRDDRIADRGIPSFRGRPVDTDASTFFGNAALSPTWARVNAFNALVDHSFGEGVTLRNRTRWADQDKFYQNVYPGAVTADGTQVSISAYNNLTARKNLFNQTDLTFGLNTGAISHALLVGAELSRQETDNRRVTGYFTGVSPTTTSVLVPVSNPVTNQPVTFRASTSDADNSGIAKGAAIYVQDQVTFSPQWQAVVGVRFDRFDLDLRNNRNGTTLTSADDLISPRAGLIYKPAEPVSIYASYSRSFLPRAGEQLASLSLTNQALDPESFTNYEVGAKWDLRPDLSSTIAVYRLNRSNVVVSDPVDPSRSVLVDGQYSKGVELGLSGRLTEAWSVMGGYAYQEGELTETQSSTARKGATLAQLPRHSASLWNRYDFSPQWGVGLGAIYRSSVYTSTDNTVTLEGFTRLDGALFYKVSDQLQLQLNVENLGDKRYYASAHNNNNITPGSPRAYAIGVHLNF